ncbi:MAG: diguanylate cyclase [Lachnospiraceae bacterium]|nr:diguanylate cyclase [Lachnospiraceae bacterium]
MQKTFVRYTLVIITIAVSFILFINFLFTMRTFETQQYNTFYTKIEQVIHTLENNQAELDIIKQNLDEDYLIRAKAAAYSLAQLEEMDVEEMEYLANLFNVDEVHFIDEKGFIRYSSVSQYVGINMDDHPQTREFLQILESDDKDAYIIQKLQPNAAENKIMKYVGVAAKGQKGVVQVGFEPTRQIEAQSRNTYEYIFSKFPTDIGEEIFVVNRTTGEILGHSGGMDREFNQACYKLEELKGCTEGTYKEGENGKMMYVVSKEYEDVLICAILQKDILFQKIWKNVYYSLWYLLFVEAAVILLLNYLIKQKVVNGIHAIIENLSAITNGNLDTTVTVGGNKELETLSAGINAMVKSIVNSSNRISEIIELSGIPLAAFEYEKGIQHVFVTSGLKELLNIPDNKARGLYRNSVLFHQYICDITKTPIEGETDIYQIHDSQYIRIHMVESVRGYMGVVIDVTKDIMDKQKMQYENTHDQLTGLYKFRYFTQLAAELLQHMQKGKLCAAVMLDLDNFKAINDTFGHDTGDLYLQKFAEIMQSMPSDHFLTARRSGDEFCMMVFDCGSKLEIEDCLDYFYQVLGKISLVLSDTKSITIKASGGFAWTADAKDNISDLLKHADEALYTMKKDRKGFYLEYKKEE